MLNFQQQVAQEADVGWVAHGKAALANPTLTEPAHLPISGNFQRVACDPMNPCIAYFLGDHWKRISVPGYFICYNSKIRWNNLRVGKAAL